MLRKGTTFEWTEQCENAFQLLKAELIKMPALQYLNPNKPLKLFTDPSKHSYSRILHQEKEGQVDTEEPELILIAYFQVHLIKPSNFGTPHKRNAIQSTDQFRNLHSILQVPTAHHIVTTNL